MAILFLVLLALNFDSESFCSGQSSFYLIFHHHFSSSFVVLIIKHHHHLVVTIVKPNTGPTTK